MYPAGHAGVALYTYKLANALAGKGLQVTLFGDNRYELDNLSARFNKANILSSKYEGIRENKSTIARIVGVVNAHCYNSHKFYSCVAGDRPEIVHLHSFFFYPIEWLLLYRLKRIKCRKVLTVHNVIPNSFFFPVLPGLELAILQYIYNLADKLIVHSEMNKWQLLKRFSVEAEKVEVIPHGEYSLGWIHGMISENEARRRLNIGKSQKVILFFGYIRRTKGIDILLRAFERVAEDMPDAVLVIAGSLIEGQSFSQYGQIISQISHRERIQCFIEYIEHEHIPTFFACADIVVLPYRELFAQSGVAHLAQGFGKGVIVTDVGGLPEVVEHGKTGLIVPAGDVKRLAEAMMHLLRHEELRVLMGQQAREMAMNRFSWETIAETTIKKAYGL
jgi:glycosyltransferase involved in cell wall biosynthesis